MADLTNHSSFDLFNVTGRRKFQNGIFTALDQLRYSEVIGPIAILICISGLCTNALTIKTFIKIGLRDGVAFSFFSLAVSDLLFTAVSLVTFGGYLCKAIEKENWHWFKVMDPLVVAVFGANVGNVLYTTSTAITAFVAIARCACVAMPLKFKNAFTRRRSAMVIALMVILLQALHIGYILHMGVAVKFDAHRNSSRLVLWLSRKRMPVKKAGQLAMFFGMSLITEVIIVVCVVVMTSKLRASVRFRSRRQPDTYVTSQSGSDSPPKSLKDPKPLKLTGKERAVVVQVVAISLVFVACNLFQMLHSWLMVLDAGYGIGMAEHHLYRAMAKTRMTCNCINASVNFYIYLHFNTRFRSVWFNKMNKSVNTRPASTSTSTSTSTLGSGLFGSTK